MSLTKPAQTRPSVLLVSKDEIDLLWLQETLPFLHCHVADFTEDDQGLAEGLLDHDLAGAIINQMNWQDSFKYAQRIRSTPLTARTPLLFIPPADETNLFDRAYDLDLADVLSVPFNDNALISKVKLFVSLQSKNKEIEQQSALLAHTMLNSSDERASHLDFKKQVDASPAMLWITERDGQCSYISQQWVEVTGQPRTESLGWGWLDAVHPGEQEATKTAFQRSTAEQTPFFSEFRLRHHSGGYRWAIDAGNPRFDAEGNFVGFAGTVIDIHEQKMARERVKASEAKLATLTDAIPLFISYLDQNYTYHFANKMYETQFGLQPAHIVGKQAWEVIGEKTFSHIKSHLDRALQGERVTLDHEISKDPTHPKWIHAIYTPDYDHKGQVKGIFISAVDVSREKLAQQKLKESEERFRTFAEAIPQMTFIADDKGNITYFNQKWYEFVNGMEGTEGWGWKDQPVHHPDDLERTVQRWKYSLETGEPYEIEYRLRRYDGEYRWHLGRALPSRDRNGQITAWFGTNTDISHVKEAETRVRASEEKLNLALTAANMGFWELDIKSGYLSLSASLMEQWSIDPNSFNHTTQEALDRIHPDDLERTQGGINAAIYEGAPYDVEYRVVLPSKEIIWVNAKGRCHTNEYGDEKLTGIAVNVTERKNASNRLREAKEEADRARDEAQRANQIKSAFLANMSHEIRTPLGAMIGFADLLRDKGLSESERENYVDILVRNGESLSVIINDILDLSKVEAGHLAFDYGEFSPKAVAQDVISLLQVKANEKRLDLRYICDESTPTLAVSDDNRVKQILINIVGNAIKFTNSGSVEIRSYCGANENGQKSICFEIKDSGIGIPQNQIQRVFEMFVQADGSMTRRFGGTGLGLALSRRLAQAMGGDVSVLKTVENEGTTFLFTFADQPHKLLSNPVSDSIAFSDQPQTITPDALTELRILVIDDAADNRQLIESHLKKRGAWVESAKDGLEGYKKALFGDYDIVLMDLQMPLMDGYSATSKLRAAGYQKPIIALTAHAMSEVRKKCLNVGCSDHLTKPIRANELIGTIAKYKEIVRPPA